MMVRSLNWNHTQWPELPKSAGLLLLLLVMMMMMMMLMPAESTKVLRHANLLYRIYPLFFFFSVSQ